MNILEFEKPIIEISKKIEELELLNKKNLMQILMMK